MRRYFSHSLDGFIDKTADGLAIFVGDGVDMLLFGRVNLPTAFVGVFTVGALAGELIFIGDPGSSFFSEGAS